MAKDIEPESTWDRLMSSAFQGAVAALIMGVGGCVNGIGAAAMDDADPPTGGRSECVVAYENVRDSLDMGIEAPRLLERVNPEDLDTACGEETDIVEDLGD